MRILLGSIAMLDEDDAPGITSPDYVVMIAIEGRLSARWFYHWFRSRYGSEFIRSMTRGAVRERLMFRRLAPATLVLPDWKRQQAAAGQFAEQLETLDRLPAALLRQAFNGKPWAMAWQPKTILRFEGSVASSSGVLRVVTDQGKGYLKALGNPEGPQILAREWVGTNLAKDFGLSTFEFCIIEVTEADELPFAKGGVAKPGPAFITRAEDGAPWGGSEMELKKLVNPHDLARLMVFDTWIRNRDRHPPPGSAWQPARRNVFLSIEDTPEGQLRLKAMDRSHCFTWTGSMTAKLAEIDEIQDERIYGRFAEFETWISRERVKRILDDLR